MKQRVTTQFLRFVEEKNSVRDDDDRKLNGFLVSNGLKSKEDKLFGIFVYTLVGSDAQFLATKVQMRLGKFGNLNRHWHTKLRSLEGHFRFLNHRYRVSVRNESHVETVIRAVDSYLALIDKQEKKSQESIILPHIRSVHGLDRFDALFTWMVKAKPIFSFGPTTYYDWLANLDSQHVLSTNFAPQKIYFKNRSSHLRNGLRKATGKSTSDYAKMEKIASELCVTVSKTTPGYCMRDLENHLCLFGKN